MNCWSWMNNWTKYETHSMAYGQTRSTDGISVISAVTYWSAAFWQTEWNVVIGWLAIKQYTRRKFYQTNQLYFKIKTLRVYAAWLSTFQTKSWPTNVTNTNKQTMTMRHYPHATLTNNNPNTIMRKFWTGLCLNSNSIHHHHHSTKQNKQQHGIHIQFHDSSPTREIQAAW